MIFSDWEGLINYDNDIWAHGEQGQMGLIAKMRGPCFSGERWACPIIEKEGIYTIKNFFLLKKMIFYLQTLIINASLLFSITKLTLLICSLPNLKVMIKYLSHSLFTPLWKI